MPFIRSLVISGGMSIGTTFLTTAKKSEEGKNIWIILLYDIEDCCDKNDRNDKGDSLNISF